MNRNNHLRSLRINIKLRDLSLINISGLSLGISCAIMILLYVRYELSYDRNQKNYNTIYRIAHTQPGHTYMGSEIFLVNPGPLKEALVMNIPEIEYATKFDTRPSVFEYNGQKVSEAGILFADPDFINVFDNFIQIFVF
jgi:putative ABC transport system permease protein